MESIINKILDDATWIEYLEFKKQQSSMSKFEMNELEEYINNKKYKNIISEISTGIYEFSIPEKHLINKLNKAKKRVVYSFEENENMVLKLITYLFSKKYDEKYSDNCYSFRKSKCVKDAIRRITRYPNINELYGYKVDIENYFNSVDVELLLAKLENFICDDAQLFVFLKNILTNHKARFNNQIIDERKGMIAGAPISSFLANIFLQDVDEYFKKKNVLYARYSDDIIFFCTKDQLEENVAALNELLNANKLTINQDKIQYINPHDKWEFLGFSYQDGIIDISDIAQKKIKGKIRRQCRKLRRWMLQKDATSERAIAAVIRNFNKKFYMVENKNKLTWSLWYFPIINTTERNAQR